MSLRPFFPFYGSKWNIARYYPAPHHDLVVESFAGSAGYSCFYEPERVCLIEADPVVANLWKYLVKVSTRDILRLPELPAVGDCVDDYRIPEEAKWLIGFWLNRGSAVPKKSRTAYSARTDKAQLNWGRRAKERIASQVDRIRHWQIIEGSYEKTPRKTATHFIDPPYLSKGHFYRFKFSKHKELGDWCLKRLGQLIVCEGPSARWLKFKPLGSFKTSKSRSLEFVYLRA